MSKNASEVTENAGPALKMVASNKAVWKIVTEGVPPFFLLCRFAVKSSGISERSDIR